MSARLENVMNQIIDNAKTILKMSIVTAALCLSQAAKSDALTININKVSESSGSIMIAIIANEEQFKNKAASTASAIVPAAQGSTSITFHNLNAGEYGVQVMHDINGNGELDANLVGMPTEPWGFSNDAAGSFGPPKWGQVKFKLASDK